MVMRHGIQELAAYLVTRHIMKSFRTLATGILLLLSLTFSSGCRYTAGQVVSQMPDVSDVDSDADTFLVLTMPVDSLDMAYRDLAIAPVRTFYKQRQEQLFWTSGFNRSLRADSLIIFIERIRYFGLHPREYHLSEISILKGKLGSIENVFRFDALLTDAYISISRHLSFGKGMQETGLADSLAISSLERYYEGGGLVDNITAGEPSSPAYRSLKQGLGQLLDALAMDHRDSVSLNVSQTLGDIKEQIETIEINLERWRSEKQDFGRRYIFVNIPAFTLYLVEDDSVILESRVIVGKPRTPTPELSSTIECFVTYPYWHVPRKISVEEYLPVIQRDISFIERNNFDVLDRKGNVLSPDSLAWEKFNKNNFPVSLRQREGGDNALGVIKFIFDNPYAVFLHDTNARRLFRSKARAFSHGCIRMEKAEELAHYLVTGDPNKKSKAVERSLREERRAWIELKEPIPIYLRYYTVDFDNGRLTYHDDIYQKDGVVTGR